MFSKGTIVAVVALAGNSIRVDAHRDGFMTRVSEALNRASGTVRRELFFHDGQEFDICDLVKIHFGNPFAEESSQGDCQCTGTLTDTTTLTCAFKHVCDEFDLLCADLQVNATLTGILKEDGTFGSDPQMDVSACVDSNLDYLETMCLHLDFAKPDFFVPQDCSFSYDGKDCTCVVDKSVPCYTFNCTGVVPEPVGHFIVSDTCKKVDLRHGGKPTMFLPALTDLPDDIDIIQMMDVASSLASMNHEFQAQVTEAEEDTEKYDDHN